MMGSAAREALAFGWAPWTAPALEDLLPQLSREEQGRLHSYLRDRQRVLKFRHPRQSRTNGNKLSVERDFTIIRHVRYALHHYNARHPGEEFDAVKPLMEARAFFRGQIWYHLNFWARCRKTRKIKRFFAEVHRAEKPPSPSCGPFGAHFPVFIPVVEACTIIEEPLGRYRKSCAFCRGHLDILHPKGRGFVCGNDKDRMVQRIRLCKSMGLEMPFTRHLGTPLQEWPGTPTAFRRRRGRAS
ncbi:unnamed protein product [Alopecurus aequalis]